MNVYLLPSVCMCEKKANLSEDENWSGRYEIKCISLFFLKHQLNNIDMASERLNTIVVPIALNGTPPLHSKGI